MRRIIVFSLFVIPAILLSFLNSCDSGSSLKDYSGTTFSDEVYKDGVQIIPGKNPM